MKWDVASITPGTPVNSATITLNVTNHSSGQSYSIYEVKRPWLESETAWNNWASGVAWQTGGAQGSNDRGSVALGTVNPSATGSYTVTLNADGRALVSRWINSPDTNYGVIIAGATSTDGFDFSSSEATTAGNRPKLTVDGGTPPSDVLPTVSAGADTVVWMPRRAQLDGTVADNGTVTTTWSLVSTVPSGGMVTFGDDNLVDTSVAFTLPTLPAGSISAAFILDLEANDGVNSAVHSEVRIDVIKDSSTITFATVGDWGDDYSPEAAQSCPALDGGETAVKNLIAGWDPQFFIGLGDMNYTLPNGTCTLSYDTTVG